MSTNQHTDNRKLIMTLEDNVSLGHAIQLSIQKTGKYRSVHTTSSAGAIEIIKKQPVEAIVLDHGLERETAFDFIMALKELPAPTKDIPVLLYSGYPIKQIARYFKDHCCLAAAISKFDGETNFCDWLDRLFSPGELKKMKAEVSVLIEDWGKDDLKEGRNDIFKQAQAQALRDEAKDPFKV